MRLEYFIEDFIENIEKNNKFEVNKMTQSELKYFLSENEDEYGREFPMICYEHTYDSNVEVDIDETKFLNDKVHDCTWIVGEKFGEVVFIIGFKEDDDELEIDTFEVAGSERGNKFASYIIDSVEYCASKYYESVYVSPFDTSAENFWKYMEYKPDYGGYLTKVFDGYED